MARSAPHTSLHMKKANIAKAFVAAALAVASQGSAQEPVTVPGTVAKVTLSLTLTAEVEGTVAKDENGKPLKKGTEGAGPAFENTYDVTKKGVKTAEVYEYATKFATAKYSNKELLLDLVELDVIEDVKGWSLVQVVSTYLDEVVTDDEETVAGVEIERGDSGFFLVKKGADPIDVSDYFYAGFGEGGGVQAYTEETVTPFAEDAPDYPFSYSASGKYKGTGMVRIDLDTEEEEHEAWAYGVFTGSFKTGTIGKDKAPIFLSGASKVSNVFGYYYEEEEDLEAVVEGSVSFANGTPTLDVSDYFTSVVVTAQ